MGNSGKSKENPGGGLRFLGTMILSLALLTLSFALYHFSVKLDHFTQELPLLTRQISETREALPKFASRVDTTLTRAVHSGGKMGNDAVEGAIQGVINEPFSLVGDLGDSLASLADIHAGSTEKAEDVALMRKKTLELLALYPSQDKLAWKNKKSGSHGTIRVVSAFTGQGRQCRKLKYENWVKDKKQPPFSLAACRKQDGKWTEADQYR